MAKYTIIAQQPFMVELYDEETKSISKVDGTQVEADFPSAGGAVERQTYRFATTDPDEITAKLEEVAAHYEEEVAKLE